MILCDDGHEEICYEGGACPLCDALETVKGLESKVSDGEAEIQKLEDEISNLRERTTS